MEMDKVPAAGYSIEGLPVADSTAETCSGTSRYC